ncbi:MAG: alpha/beta hydrolase family protein [bacterium]
MTIQRTKNVRPLFVFILWLLFMVVCPKVQGAENKKYIVGDWQGILQVSGLKLRLVFHISATPEDLLKATMDSPDQGATGIPVSKVIFEKGKVRLEVQSIAGIYEGTFNKEKMEIEGHWSQGGQTMPLILKRVEKEKEPELQKKERPVSAADLKRIEGIWQGVLKISGIELRIVFKISATPERILKATLDSPDQGAKDIPVSKVTFEKDKLRIEAISIGGVFEGKYQEKGPEIVGTWQQGGQTLPLNLKRVEKVPEVKRPQEPKKPYPYQEEEVKYENKTAGIKLAGTLTMPRSGRPFPAVLLISGSGPQDRNETVMAHKPFWVLADYLTRQGIAVLRVDDRGIGKSTGNFYEATSEDFASDALAGVAYLKSRKEINPYQIGLIGHSEGGIIAPMVATQSPDVTYIVLMAGTGLSGEQIMYLQKALILKALGASQELIDLDRKISEQIFTVVKEEKDKTVAEKKIREYFSQFWEALSDPLKEEFKKFADPRTALDASLKMYLSPWFRFFLTYDPRPTLMKLSCPVLAINGELDLQVPPKENLGAIEEALKAGGNKHYTIKELPGLNHLFQTTKTGAPSEYAKIEETMSPVALKIIADWIKALTDKRKTMK